MDKNMIFSSPQHSSSELICHGAASVIHRPSVHQLSTFWTFSQDQLKESTPNLPQMFVMRS